MTALVGIIMGSDSDLPVMQAAADVLAELEGEERAVDLRVNLHRREFVAGGVAVGLEVDDHRKLQPNRAERARAGAEVGDDNAVER